MSAVTGFLRRSFLDRNPYLVGLFSVLAIGAATGFAFLVGIQHRLEKAYTVTAVFGDASGVRSGDDVRVAGIKAGRVAGVDADRRTGTVRVTLKVNDGVELADDATAEVALETLLGTKFVRLGGPVRAPYLHEVPESRRVIPIERTRTPFDVFELTKLATGTVQATDTEKLNRLITDLADITEGKHDQIRDLVDGIARVSDAVNTRDQQVSELLDRAQTLSATLAEKDQTLVGLIDQSQGILGFVERRQGDIAAGLRAGNSAVGHLAGVLHDTRTDLDAILTTLHPTLAIVERHQQDLDRALTWLGPGSLGLSQAVVHGPWADVYVRNIGPDVVCTIARLQNPAAPC